MTCNFCHLHPSPLLWDNCSIRIKGLWRPQNPKIKPGLPLVNRRTPFSLYVLWIFFLQLGVAKASPESLHALDEAQPLQLSLALEHHPTLADTELSDANAASLSVPPPLPLRSEEGSRIALMPPPDGRTQDTARLRLARYVSETLRNNPQALQTEAESRAAEHRASEMRGALLPRLTASAVAAHETQERGSGFDTDFKQRQGQLRVTLPLFDPSIYAQLAQRRAASLGADWRLTDVREQLMLRAIETYIELLKADRLLILAQRNLRTHRDYVAQVKEIARHDLGRAADIAAAVARTALAEAVLTSRLARLEAVRSTWRQVTGLAPPETLDDAPWVRLPESLDTALQIALSEHPMVRLAEAEIVLAREGVQAARAGFKPKFNFEANTRTGNDWGGYAGKQDANYVGVSAEWNLFAGFSDSYATKAAQEGVVAAQNAHDRIRNELRNRVEIAWYELRSADASLRAFDDYALSTKQMVDATADQFRVGRKSLLDVLNAENERFTALSNVETTRQDLALASWRLHSLQGRVQDELQLRMP